MQIQQNNDPEEVAQPKKKPVAPVTDVKGTEPDLLQRLDQAVQAAEEKVEGRRASCCG